MEKALFIYQTKKKGGKGAVREICDIIYHLQDNIQ